MKPKGDFQPSKEVTENYFRRYITEYRRFLEEKFSERKEDFALYTRYPYHIIVYITKQGIEVEYVPNVDELKIEVRLDRISPKEPNAIHWASITNSYLERIIDKPCAARAAC